MPQSRLQDTARGYGWISIGLHWISAIAIVAIWIAGNSIGAGGGDFEAALRLHTSLALSAYAVLAARIFWRLKSGHPGRLPTQWRISFGLGMLLHYGLLLCMIGMLVSGPLLAWCGGLPLQLFDWTLLPPVTPKPAAFALLQKFHATTASLLMIGVLLHILGVLFHLPIAKDRTFEKMMIADKGDSAGRR